MVWSTLAGSGDYNALCLVGDITSAPRKVNNPDSGIREIFTRGIRNPGL